MRAGAMPVPPRRSQGVLPRRAWLCSRAGRPDLVVRAFCRSARRASGLGSGRPRLLKIVLPTECRHADFKLFVPALGRFGELGLSEIVRDGETRGGSLLLDVSNAMVSVFKERFGRGPTKVRASWAGPDVLTVVLEDTLTPVERNLAAMGEHARLRELRTFFQYASVSEFCEPVERITGRKVRAFVSGIDTAANGLCVETFVLHPEGSDEPSRADSDLNQRSR